MRWLPPLLTIMSFIQSGLFLEMSRFVATDPAGRPWFITWQAGIVYACICFLIGLRALIVTVHVWSETGE